MTDDRTLDRAARSWLEEGPTRAPDRPVEAALSRIQVTRQERDMLPRRITQMPMFAKLAAAAVVLVGIGGGAILALNDSLPSVGASPSPVGPASASPQASVADPIGEYRSLRNAVCVKATEAVSAVDLGGLYDTTLSAPERAAVNAEHVKYTDAVEAAAAELAAIDPPAALAAEHWKDVAREESIAALHGLFDERVAAGDIAGGAALDEAIVRAAQGRSEFEGANRLIGCP
jgi:hypothetical protein